MPPRIGYKAADWLAERIAARHDLPIVQAIRVNQWVARGRQLDSEELNQSVVEALRFQGRSFYQIFHTLHDPDAMQSMVEFSPTLERIITDSQKNERGLIVLGVHMGNFDLVLQAAAYRGLHALALSLPGNDATIEWQHKFRRNVGMEILPTSASSLRTAIQRLQQGGTVLTGVDHPLETAKYKPNFFGSPASVPVHYVQLAIKSGAPLILLASYKDSNGIYQIMSSDEIQMRSYPNRSEQLLRNAETVLEEAEHFIKSHPTQWMLVQPAWPEEVGRMP